MREGCGTGRHDKILNYTAYDRQVMRMKTMMNMMIIVMIVMARNDTYNNIKTLLKDIR